MKLIKDIPYNGQNPCQKLDIWLPDTEAFSVFIYFHGGGLESGSKQDGERIAPYLTERNICVVSPDYRMYPAGVYPDFIRDGAAAVAWVCKNISQYGACDRIYVGGSSAGGYLSQMLCFDKKYLAVHGINADAMAGYFHDAGQPTVHFNVLRERGLDSRRLIVDEAAPLYHVTENPGYAPMEIVVSDHDMQNRYEQSVLLYSTLKHFGNDMSKIKLNVVTNSGHCQYLGQQDEKGNNLLAKMVYAFIQTTEKYR